jgi:hypothetical protein
MPLVILHHLLNVFVQLANKRGFKQKKSLAGLDGNMKCEVLCRETRYPDRFIVVTTVCEAVSVIVPEIIP